MAVRVSLSHTYQFPASLRVHTMYDHLLYPSHTTRHHTPHMGHTYFLLAYFLQFSIFHFILKIKTMADEDTYKKRVGDFTNNYDLLCRAVLLPQRRTMNSMYDDSFSLLTSPSLFPFPQTSSSMSFTSCHASCSHFSPSFYVFPDTVLKGILILAYLSYHIGAPKALKLWRNIFVLQQKRTTYII